MSLSLKQQGQLLMATIAHTHLPTTHSTNSQLIDWVVNSYEQTASAYQQDFANQLPDYRYPYRLTAASQTHGRGQHGRTWQSPHGNVYLSLYIPAHQNAKMPSQSLLATAAHPTPSQSFCQSLMQRLDGRLSLCVGYQLSQMPVLQAINQQRQQHHLPQIGVKWVNDVGFYQGSEFQKLAGILIEPVSVMGNLLGVVVGVGMNISFSPVLNVQSQEGLNYQAVCLQSLADSQSSYQTLTAQNYYMPIEMAILQAIARFNGLSGLSHSQNPSPKMTQFIQDFAQVDVLKDKLVQINLPMVETAPMIGTVCGIDGNGSLQICQNDGTIRAVWAGTIKVL